MKLLRGVAVAGVCRRFQQLAALFAQGPNIQQPILIKASV